MPVYTVHEPPLRSADPLLSAERIVFVRDGFSFWAFLVSPLWMLWHRMWLVLAGYIVIVAALVTPIVIFGASAIALALVGLFIALLVGLEASTLRRFTLRMRRWRTLSVVSGHDVEDAERRFFASWSRPTSARREASAAKPPLLPPSSLSAPRAPQRPDVIGLFPEPGGGR